MITKLPKPIDQACCIRVVRCSGTIRKAEEEAVRRAKDYIIKARGQGGMREVGSGLGVGGNGEGEERDVGDVVSESEGD
jgi:ribonuclease P/MRP protein subunit POP5